MHPLKTTMNTEDMHICPLNEGMKEKKSLVSSYLLVETITLRGKGVGVLSLEENWIGCPLKSCLALLFTF